MKTMEEITYKGGTIYKVNDILFCLVKDNFGFSECYRSLETAQKEYDENAEREKANYLFRQKQENEMKALREKEDQRVKQAQARKQEENELHVKKALDKIMGQDENILTELYFRDGNGNKTIKIKSIKDSKQFIVKFSREKEKTMYYSELAIKLVSIKNRFPCGRWY
jgi:hypothetical protein